MSAIQIKQEMMADRKHQCAADALTNRGEMVLYFGWKVVSGTTYIEATVVPVIE